MSSFSVTENKTKPIRLAFFLKSSRKNNIKSLMIQGNVLGFSRGTINRGCVCVCARTRTYWAGWGQRERLRLWRLAESKICRDGWQAGDPEKPVM